jgi:hypothetical protein
MDIRHTQQPIGSVAKLMKDALCEHRVEFRLGGAEPVGGFLERTEHATHDRHSHLSGVQRDHEAGRPHPACQYSSCGMVDLYRRLPVATRPRPQ